MLDEFKKFLIKGNMIDMAVGFIFGAAFATLVKSMVSNIIMPPVGLLMGRVDFSQLFIALDGNHYASLAELDRVGAPAIRYGVFVNDAISFVILGFVMFMMIKTYSKIKAADEVVEKRWQPQKHVTNAQWKFLWRLKNVDTVAVFKSRSKSDEGVRREVLHGRLRTQWMIKMIQERILVCTAHPTLL